MMKDTTIDPYVFEDHVLSKGGFSMQISKVMSKEVVYVNDNVTVTHARQLMRDHFLRGLPVIDNSERVLGMITDQDILNITSTRSDVTVSGYVHECPMITPETDVLEAAKLMLDAKLERAPVIASVDDRRIAGILSNADILRNIYPTKVSPATAGDVMTSDVRTCSTSDNVATIWSSMITIDYTGLPVMSEDEEVIGMFTRQDIIRSGFTRTSINDTHGTTPADTPKIEKIMSTPAYTVSPDTPITKCMGMILQYDIGRLTVVDNGYLVGILNRNDLLRACMLGSGK